MKSFTTFLLAETLSAPAPWKRKRDSEDPDLWRATFQVGGHTYRATFEPTALDQDAYSDDENSYIKNGWDFTFSRRDKYRGSSYSNLSVTGSGQAFTVFATIVDILKTFLDEVEPEHVFFGGHEESRIKLYTRLCRMVPRLNPQYRQDPKSDLTHGDFIISHI